MNKDTHKKIALLVTTLVVCFIFCEITIRRLGHYDADGNFYITYRHLKPFRLPIASTQLLLEKYNDGRHSIQGFMQYDADLGWSLRPLSQSGDGLYKVNSDGIRTGSQDQKIDRIPAEGVLRIAVFGDSFTFSDDVTYKDSWPYHLEQSLKKANIKAEVINFGVGGYGIDQAYLRFKTFGAAFSPHIVILGFQPEGLTRNLNLIRALHNPMTRLPLSKPRFILKEDKLELINSPAVKNEELISVLNNFNTWDLKKYERLYNPENYRETFLGKSKGIALLRYLLEDGYAIKPKEKAHMNPEGEQARLHFKLLSAFERESSSINAKFLIVHLPRLFEMRTLIRKDPLGYEEILRKMDQTYNVIHPEYALLKQAEQSGLDSLFIGHYSAISNKIVADAIFDYLINKKYAQGYKNREE